MSGYPEHRSAHSAVLLDEAVRALVTDPNGVYVDGTFGRGGHARKILAALSEDGRLIAFDKDPDAVAVGKELAAEDPRFEILSGSFAGLAGLLSERQLEEKVTGLFLDLGVSSPQLDKAERGFSFMNDGPLDMRMNPEEGLSAAQWLKSAEESEIADVLKVFGEERYARRIAAAIVREREVSDITGTLQLAEIVKQAHPRWERGKHPATKAFQGIRIFINRELDDLKVVLDASLLALPVSGRLVVISFHSLEDRLVKRFIRHSGHEKREQAPRHVPIMEADIEGVQLKNIGKVIKSSAEELLINRRARSAIMRVAERVA